MIEFKNSVPRDLFLEVLKKYIEAETGMIYEYSGNFAKSFKKLNETVDEYLIRSGVASDDLKRYKEEAGIFNLRRSRCGRHRGKERRNERCNYHRVSGNRKEFVRGNGKMH